MIERILAGRILPAFFVFVFGFIILYFIVMYCKIQQRRKFLLRVTTLKSKNAESFYTLKGWINDKGVSASAIVSKYRTLKKLLPEHDDVMAWAKYG